MLYFPKWKIALILGVCLLGILFTMPNMLPSAVVKKIPNWLPNQQVRLGLDLRGGSYLLLQVDVGSLTKDQLENLVENVRETLAKARIGYKGLGIVNNAVQVTIRSQADVARADKLLQALATPLSGGLFGGRGQTDITVNAGADGAVTLKPTEAALDERSEQAVQQSIAIVRRRIDATGINEPEIQRQGNNQILVQLPGLKDPTRIKRLLGKTARLTFQLLDSSPEAEAGHVRPGSELLYSDHNGPNGKPIPYIVRRQISVSGADLTDAQATFDSQNGEPVVSFRLNALGAQRFADVTRNNVGKPFAIVLDNKVISAPVIREPILGGSGQISGNFTVQSANDLAILLRAGALPAPLRVIEERTVGPQLGADSIRSGVEASIIGFLLVVGYMTVSYGLFGIFANAALIANLFLILGVMSALQATLTLPGIAGILLTTGMAVDANVLINERIREEYLLGKSPLAAMEAGFARAFTTIFDSNSTTLIKMAILFALGAGPVRGFAVTISIGILTSMFTAILLTRLLMVFWYRRRRPAALPV